MMKIFGLLSKATYWAVKENEFCCIGWDDILGELTSQTGFPPRDVLAVEHNNEIVI